MEQEQIYVEVCFANAGMTCFCSRDHNPPSWWKRLLRRLRMV